MTTDTERETRMYWRIARDLAVAKLNGLAIDDHLEEIDAIRMYTESESLRSRCRNLIEANSAKPFMAAGI